MNFKFTEDEQKVIDIIHEFGVNEVAPLAAMGKLYAAEAATNITRRCCQLAGYDGYLRTYPFERLMRDAKITEIYEGTGEVQKMVISASMGIK